MEESAYKVAGRHLKRLRQENGWTQKEVAEKVDITEGFLSFLESGTKQGSLDTYIRLGALLDISLPELFRDGQPAKKGRKHPTVSLDGLSAHEIKIIKQTIRALRARKKGEEGS
jgi:transcriptional regulator with XRE-family HTH domain